MEQFCYYLKVNWINIARAPLPYALTILILSVGLGVFFANATFYYWLKHDPLPHKSATLFYPLVKSQPFVCDEGCAAPKIHSYRDVIALQQSDIPSKSAAMYSAGAYVRLVPNKTAAATDLPAVGMSLRITQRDFFSMFEVPVQHGQVWPDNTARHEVILSHEAALKLFGRTEVVGERLELDHRIFTISAVLAPWRMFPRLYDPQNDGYLEATEDIFLPLETGYDLNYVSNRQSSSFDDANYQKLASDGRSKALHQLQFWVQLDDADAQRNYRDFMRHWVEEQKKLGRHPSADQSQLVAMRDIMRTFKAQSQEVIAFALVTLLFLIVCLCNACHLSLNRFIANQYEISLRRALGASRGQLQIQLLADVCCTAGLALLLALPLAWLTVQGISVLLPNQAVMASWNGVLLGSMVLLTLCTSYLVTLYPALRASFGNLSLQLKA